MAQPHDEAVLGLRRHFQARRKSLLAREERVVPAHFETLRQSFENPQVAMHDGGRLTVHWIVQYAQFPAECLHHSLQTEAHAEYWNSRARGEIHQIGNSKVG